MREIIVREGSPQTSPIADNVLDVCDCMAGFDFAVALC